MIVISARNHLFDLSLSTLFYYSKHLPFVVGTLIMLLSLYSGLFIVLAIIWLSSLMKVLLEFIGSIVASTAEASIVRSTDLKPEVVGLACLM